MVCSPSTRATRTVQGRVLSTVYVRLAEVRPCVGIVMERQDARCVTDKDISLQQAMEHTCLVRLVDSRADVWVCGGTGRCVCTQYEYPGYMPGSTIVVGVDGQVISNINYGSGSSGSSSSGSSSRSSSGSSKRSGVGCSQCNYTGVDPSPSGGNLTSWVAYYNSSGNKCPYCGHYDSHQHARCAHCNVPTR